MPPGAAGDRSVASAILIDAHAHLWDLAELDRFLDAAHRNLERAAQELTLGEEPARVLLVMDVEPGGLFEPGVSGTPSGSGAWRLEPTGEAGSVQAARSEDGDDHQPILLVEGRQVVTAEGLELLAAPCSKTLPGGLPLRQAMAAARRAQAIPILPWGFGKWWGSRGREVAAILESFRPGDLLIGDNGGRARAAWKPRLLTLAAQRGFLVLRGSDPLPLPGDVGRAGSFGSLLRGRLDPVRPSTGVRHLLGGLQSQPRSFGRGVGLGTFLANQLRLRLRSSK